MRQAIGLGFESRRAQKNFSVRDILSRFYHPGQKPPELLSRQPNPGSKTGTNGPLEPGQMARSVVVPWWPCALHVVVSGDVHFLPGYHQGHFLFLLHYSSPYLIPPHAMHSDHAHRRKHAMRAGRSSVPVYLCIGWHVFSLWFIPLLVLYLWGVPLTWWWNVRADSDNITDNKWMQRRPLCNLCFLPRVVFFVFWKWNSIMRHKLFPWAPNIA
jgi:hypothetical protein